MRGRSVLDALPDLLQQTLRASDVVHLARQSVPHRVQTRLSSNAEAQSAIARAQQRRKDHGIAFWDALLMESVAEGESLPVSVLDAAQFHQPLMATTTMRVGDVSFEELRQTCEALGPREIYSFLSRVERPGQTLHVPLLDFALPSGTEAAEHVAVQIMERLRVPGWLFRSGRSFHFYGRVPLRLDDWHRFLGRAALFAPLVDQRWIAHQLIEGNSALRISGGSERQVVPVCVATVPAWEPA